MSMIERIDGIARERATRYDKQYIDEPFPPPREWGAGLIFVGGYSLTMLEDKVQYLKDTIKLPNSSVTPTQASRDYVTAKFPERLHSRKSQWAWWEEFHRSQPMATSRGRYKDMVYLDLKSAYWSITSLVGWDCEYFRYAIVRGDDVHDFPFQDNKIARNSLVSNFLPSKNIIAYRDGRLVTLPNKKRQVNYGLWCLVMDVLHAVAWDVWNKFDAVYVNTDGYIIPAHHQDNAMEFIRQKYGLESRQKGRGVAQVWGVGVYDLGEHRAKQISKYSLDVFSINNTGQKNRDAISKYLQWFRRLTV